MLSDLCTNAVVGTTNRHLQLQGRSYACPRWLLRTVDFAEAWCAPKLRRRCRVQVNAKAGQLGARETFSHMLRVRIQCVHAMLLALAACVIICLAQTAAVRKMHVDLDIIERKVACGASLPARGACACVCPIIAAVFEIEAPRSDAMRCACLAPEGGLFPLGRLRAVSATAVLAVRSSLCCASGLSGGHGSLYALRGGLLDCCQGSLSLAEDFLIALLRVCSRPYKRSLFLKLCGVSCGILVVKLETSRFALQTHF